METRLARIVAGHAQHVRLLVLNDLVLWKERGRRLSTLVGLSLRDVWHWQWECHDGPADIGPAKASAALRKPWKNSAFE